MTVFKIKLAEFVFEIHALYPLVAERCQDYLTNDEAEKEIYITEEDLCFEAQMCVKEAQFEGVTIPFYQPNELEVTAVYRKIADYISYNNSMVFHGALISYRGEGYLFTAKSGTGKTTHINNWLKEFPGCVIVNGDKPILRIDGEKVVGYGTPWQGKEGYGHNTSVAIKAIVILERSKQNEICEIEYSQAWQQLLSQSYRPKDQNGIQRALKSVMQMNGKVHFFKLGCNMSQSSARVAFNGINQTSLQES